MMPSKDIERGAAHYGAAQGLLKGAANRGSGHVQKPPKAGPANLIICVAAPWFIFFATYYIWGFAIRYWAGILALILIVLIGVACLASVGAVVQSARGKMNADPIWMGLLCVLSIVAYCWALAGASASFVNGMQPYFDLQKLNVYRSVNPSTSEGNQFMDFGVFNFVPTASIDRVLSMTFKNEDFFCVAPVKLNETQPASYDFWAVGKNCCSQHLSDFRCGEWNNPGAKSGVRVTSESARQFYQLAAKQAAAAYNIPVKHPVFFEWVADPADHINSMAEDAYQAWFFQSFCFFCLEVVLVFLATWVF